MEELGQFEVITGYDIRAFLTRFTTFINNQSQNIIDYYQGFLSELDRDSYREFQELQSEVDIVLNLFDFYYERFALVSFWDLIESIDDIKIKLETIDNFSKFARTSVERGSFNTDVEIEVNKRRGETLEELVARLGSFDRQNDWIELAENNFLIEEDYTPEGSKLLIAKFKNNARFFIESVVDVITPESIKGLDVARRISFVDDDLQTLSYDETVNQTLDVLVGLRKNDNPEFPQHGIDPSVILGMSERSVTLPSITRQLFQTFSTDDYVQQLTITSTSFERDSVMLDFDILTRSALEQKRTLNLNGN